jgi:hypothetical protein
MRKDQDVLVIFKVFTLVYLPTVVLFLETTRYYLYSHWSGVQGLEIKAWCPQILICFANLRNV